MTPSPPARAETRQEFIERYGRTYAEAARILRQAIEKVGEVSDVEPGSNYVSDQARAAMIEAGRRAGDYAD